MDARKVCNLQVAGHIHMLCNNNSALKQFWDDSETNKSKQTNLVGRFLFQIECLKNKLDLHVYHLK
jgi:hypothetical protein